MLTIIELALKYWKYVAVGAAVAVLVVFYNVHVDGLEKRYAAAKVAAVDAAYKKGSDAATAAAAADIALKNKQHSTELAAVKDTYENAIKQNDSAHAADAQRLRQLAAASDRRADGVLAGSAGPGAAAGSGSESAGGLGSVPAQLGLSLADALRQDDAALNACYAERNSLTGK